MNQCFAKTLHAEPVFCAFCFLITPFQFGIPTFPFGTSLQNKDMTNTQTIKIAVPFIRRKLGIKNVDKKRIEVFRTPDHRYIISYRGTGYQLNRKED
mgnify:CR=1 FL=1